MIRLLFIFILISFLFASLNLTAEQTKIIDSLKNELSQVKTDKAYLAKLNLEISKKSLSTDGFQYAQKAFELYEQLKDSTKMCLALEEISAHHRKLGNNAKAVEILLQALKINEKLKKNKNIAVISTQIGTLYVNDKDCIDGLKYLLKGYDFFKQSEDSLNMALSCINIGEAYRLMDSLSIAENYFKESLELNKKLNSEIIEGYCKGNIGLTYSAQEKFDIAKENLQQSIEILQQYKDYYSISLFQAEIANILIKDGAVNKGEKLLIESLKLAKQQNIKEQISAINKILSEFYEQQKEFKKSLQYRKDYELYNDSLKNLVNIRKIEQLQNQYQIEKIQTNLNNLEKNNKAKRKTVYILAISSFLLVLLTIFLLQTNQAKKKAFNNLNEQKIIIEKREQEKAILLRELNHRVKNNLQMVSSLLSLQAFEFKDHPAAEALKISKYRVEALSLIHQKLYNQNLDTEISLKDYIEELTKSLLFNFGKNIKLQLDIDQTFIMFEQAIPIGLIINELVTNALKYAYTNVDTPIMQICLKKESEFMELTVADNGIGLQGVDYQKARSLGLKLVKSLVSQVNGSIEQKNENGCIWMLRFKPDKQS